VVGYRWEVVRLLTPFLFICDIATDLLPVHIMRVVTGEMIVVDFCIVFVWCVGCFIFLIEFFYHVEFCCVDISILSFALSFCRALFVLFDGAIVLLSCCWIIYFESARETGGGCGCR